MKRYGKGGWRGRPRAFRAGSSVRIGLILLGPCCDLSGLCGVENTEVRELIFELIGAGKLTSCADIAYGVAMDKKASHTELGSPRSTP